MLLRGFVTLDPKTPCHDQCEFKGFLSHSAERAEKLLSVLTREKKKSHRYIYLKPDASASSCTIEVVNTTRDTSHPKEMAVLTSLIPVNENGSCSRLLGHCSLRHNAAIPPAGQDNLPCSAMHTAPFNFCDTSGRSANLLQAISDVGIVRSGVWLCNPIASRNLAVQIRHSSCCLF